GITAVEGEFTTGDPVNCVDSEGNLLGKGLVNYSSGDIHSILGLKTSQIYSALGHKDYDEVIHRDNLVITCDTKKNKN
ncbi:MAG: glutamate 5-kinase, partial [Deltaproteobacteria bacterium HGW-Deltaproteobacteria-1]